MKTTFALAGGAVALFTVGCTSATSMPLESGSGGAETTSVGAGGSGGATTGGAGGQGGGASNECGQDCSKVQVPPCLLSVCDPVSKQCQVVPDPSPTPCDDGQYCTVGDTCKEGKCQGGVSNDCGIAADPCTAITCKEATKSCVKEPQSDGTPCANSDLCMVNAQCSNGQCVGAPKDCFFAPGVDDCHTGTCDPKTGKCTPVPGNDGAACVDAADLCTQDKTCSKGTCGGGQAKDCSWLDYGCEAGVCDAKTGECSSQPVGAGGACSDAEDECNAGVCDAKGACVALPLKAGTACPSANAECAVGQCDGKGACMPVMANDGKACSDGNACTSNDICSKGACSGTPQGGLTTYFTEPFKDNAKGWTLGKEWQIGPAKASPGQGEGGSYEDPAFDHTQAGDNGVAGVAIGGYANTAADHDYYYLQSPVIDTSAAPAQIYLQFWRWLNTDTSYWMANSVECTADGQTWKILWESDGENDDAWTPVSYDMSACKGAGTMLRWGMSIVDSSAVYTESSWNLDDVAIVNQSCF